MSETKKNNKKVTSNIILVNTDALDKSMLYVFTIALHILLSSSQILDVDGYGAKLYEQAVQLVILRRLSCSDRSTKSKINKQ